MKKSHNGLVAICAGLLLAAVTNATPVDAALITITGSNFDVTYDTTKLGLFGTPALVGNQLSFTPVGFSAQSINGTPALTTTNSTVNGLTLSAHSGFQFGGFALTEIGDYVLAGAGSFVNVNGQLRAFDLANPANTNTSASLSVSPATPLTIADFANHDWLAGATITAATASLLGLSNWLPQAKQVNLTLENILYAFTTNPNTSSPFTDAFIEKKFSGVSIDVMPVPVPVPASGLLFLSGALLFGGLMFMSKRFGAGPGRRPRKDSMRVAIVSINYAPELTGIGVYSTGMAEHFARRGDTVTVYTAFTYYPAWAKSAADRRRLFRAETLNGVAVRRSYLYVPQRPSALRRMVHELSFVVSTTVNYLCGPRAECTVIVSPSLLLGLPIATIAWLKRSRSVFHVQDLQPDAAVDLGMLRPGKLSRILFALEKLTYQYVDAVSTISEGMRARIIAKGVPAAKVILFRNWANDTLVARRDPQTALRKAWGLDGKYVVLYSGNLGVKQGLGSVLEAAAILRDRHEIAFVIVGDGGEKAALVEHAARNGLANVMFKPLQPPDMLAELLASADISVVPQKRGVKDIVLPSKLSNIMASERAVVGAAPQNSEIARILRDGAAGILVEPEDAQAMAVAILELYESPQLAARLAANAKRYMDSNLRETPVIEAFRARLTHLVAGSARGLAAQDMAAATAQP